jgi:DNA modification methylase
MAHIPAPTFRPIASLTPWERNYNRGDVPAIALSIQVFGFNGRLAVHGSTVMAGNHALAALRQLESNEAPFPSGQGLRLEKDGSWSVLVITLDHLSRSQAEAYAIADNRTRDLATTDDEQLAALLQAISDEDMALLAATGYEQDDLDKLLASLDDATVLDVDAEPKIELAEELRAKWGTEPGQLWLLGEHRLLRGDSTNPADVQRLMDGERSRLFATDPPYLVDYTGTNHPSGKNDSAKRKAVQNTDWSDTYKDWDDSSQGAELYQGFVREAIAHAITEDAAWYCWHASRRQAMLEAVWEEHGAFVHQQIIWAKDRGILTRSWYQWQHEPCFFGWIRGQKPLRLAQDYPGTVWSFPTTRPGESTGHPTSKPVQLFEIPMLQHTNRGDICYEPFSGSGSQIIAGERVGRRVYAMEKAPEFIAVALERWAEATGKTPLLADAPAPGLTQEEPATAG